jgi:3-phenylpropionate/trans-cinnamate dioxygenase ferredoxin reductase subunit
LRSPEFFAEQRIELLTRTRVTSFDPITRCVALDSGAELDYGWLALATGASPRPLRLPGADAADVFNLRTLDDARAVAAAAESARHVCVIGGGYIGLEVAAALRSRGKMVTVLEGAPRVLGRSMPELMSAYVESTHRKHGVDLRTGQRIRCLRAHMGRVAAVELENGTRIDCDMVVLGIGVAPNTGLASAAGLAVSDGVDTDRHGRTSVPYVVAAGDVACMEFPSGGSARMRLESIQAANDGAKAAAATIAGRMQPFTAVPWFWSDQFELKFQMAGVALPGDQAVVRGDMDSDKFSVAYLRRGVLAAMHSVNRPAEHMLARKLIAARVALSPEQLGDPSFDLKRSPEPQVHLSHP